MAPTHGAFTGLSFTISDNDLVEVLAFTTKLKKETNVNVSDGHRYISYGFPAPHLQRRPASGLCRWERLSSGYDGLRRSLHRSRRPAGCSGKMGTAVRNIVANRQDCQISAGFDQVPMQLDFPVYTAMESIAEHVDVVVDFSHPTALESLLQYCKKHSTPAVLCTTAKITWCSPTMVPPRMEWMPSSPASRFFRWEFPRAFPFPFGTPPG